MSLQACLVDNSTNAKFSLVVIKVLLTFRVVEKDGTTESNAEAEQEEAKKNSIIMTSVDAKL